MNPWQLIKREVGGAARSLRYDLARRRDGAEEDTARIPLAAPGRGRGRQRLVLSGGALLLISGGVGTYYAIAEGVEALLSDDGGPQGMPQGRPSRSAGPTTNVEQPPEPVLLQPEPVTSTRVLVAAPLPSSSALLPPVPTPGPTCPPLPAPSPEATKTPAQPSASASSSSPQPERTCVSPSATPPSPSPSPSASPSAPPSPSNSPSDTTGAP